MDHAQSSEFVKELYEDLKDDSKIHWKESIKGMLGLPEEEIG